MNIKDKLKEGKGGVSLEFFPPKTDAGIGKLLAEAEKLKEISPDFTSVTFGAGGSTQSNTLDLCVKLREQHGFHTMPHLTCVGSSKDRLGDILDEFKDNGIKDVLALRGDAPKDVEHFQTHPDGFQYANELVSFIKSKYDFAIGVAAYPEVHPESESADADLENLKRKVDSGADFIITQLFFDNAHFYKFREKCDSIGINIPILAGILPAMNLKGIERMCDICGSQIPEQLYKKMSAVSESKEDMKKVGVEWAISQSRDLMRSYIDGLHIYCLNKADASVQIYKQL